MSSSMASVNPNASRLQADSMLSDMPQHRRIQDLVRLAALCIEALEQNEQFHSDAFQFLDDLIQEHEELFWSLFCCDLGTVMEYYRSSQDIFSAFPVFTCINEHLISNPRLSGGKFHTQLKDIFSPLVVRYLDLMESALNQLVTRDFEHEKWKGEGQGCHSSEELLSKLEKLNDFMYDLKWPDEEFASQLDLRFRQMSAELIEASAQKTMEAFHVYNTRSKNTTDYEAPLEICVMINTMLHLKNVSLKVCTENGADTHQLHAKVDKVIERSMREIVFAFVDKFKAILQFVLAKLARYDEGSFLAPILAFAKSQMSDMSSAELGKSYVSCFSKSIEQIQPHVNDEDFTRTLLERLYETQMKCINEWLEERKSRSLHSYQVNCLSLIANKLYQDMSMLGTTEDVLNNSAYTAIQNRMRAEEATIALQATSGGAGGASPGLSLKFNSVMGKAKKLSGFLG